MAREMTSEERLKKFHTDEVSHYPDLGGAFNFKPIESTTHALLRLFFVGQ